MARIAVFASGNGSNFQVLAESFKVDKNNKIILLICNKKDAFVLKRAEKLNIPYEIVIYKKNDIIYGENKIIELIKKYDIDIIFLAGYMRVLSGDFLKKVKVPVINIHPALLPKYKGVDAIERAFNSEDKEIGITIHYVIEEVDSGEIILQKSIRLKRTKGLDFVEQEVHKLEHKYYPQVAKKLCKNINNKLKK